MTSWPPFDVPEHWRERLGKFRTDAIAGSRLFLTAIAPSNAPEILDQENRVLQRAVERLYLAYLITAGPIHHREAFAATGAIHDGAADVRGVRHLAAVYRTAGMFSRPVTRGALDTAVTIAGRMAEWKPSGPHGRIERVYRAFCSGVQSQNLPERLHQFVRVLEGLFKTGQGRGRVEFKERLADLVGPGHDEVADVFYKTRSAVEHLRDPFSAMPPDVDPNQFLGRYAAIVEALARSTLQAVFLNDDLWAAFESQESVDAFWALTPEERREIWGKPADLKALSRSWDEADWKRATAG